MASHLSERNRGRPTAFRWPVDINWTRLKTSQRRQPTVFQRYYQVYKGFLGLLVTLVLLSTKTKEIIKSDRNEVDESQFIERPFKAVSNWKSPSIYTCRFWRLSTLIWLFRSFVFFIIIISFCSNDRVSEKWMLERERERERESVYFTNEWWLVASHPSVETFQTWPVRPPVTKSLIFFSDWPTDFIDFLFVLWVCLYVCVGKQVEESCFSYQ